jgi:hypothetical protein
MGWLKHLSGVQRVEVGEIVAHAVGHIFENPGHGFFAGATGGIMRRQAVKFSLKNLGCAAKQAGNGIGIHGDLSIYHIGEHEGQLEQRDSNQWLRDIQSGK